MRLQEDNVAEVMIAKCEGGVDPKGPSHGNEKRKRRGRAYRKKDKKPRVLVNSTKKKKKTSPPATRVAGLINKSPRAKKKNHREASRRLHGRMERRKVIIAR